MQSTQQAGGYRVELTHMAEGEFPQKRPQRGRRIGSIEDDGHSTVTQQCHVSDAVGAGDHARDQRVHLRPGMGVLVGRLSLNPWIDPVEVPWG